MKVRNVWMVVGALGVVAGTGAAVVNAAERDDVAGDGAVVQERSSDPTDPDVSATTTDASRTPATTPTATTPADSPTSMRVPSPATPATQTAPSPPSPVTASPVTPASAASAPSASSGG